MDVNAHRLTVEAFATDLELANAPYSAVAIIRERLHQHLAEIMEQRFLSSRPVPGGVAYRFDMLVMPPEVMVELVQAEAARQLKRFGYASA